jgi:hypothetical protein
VFLELLNCSCCGVTGSDEAAPMITVIIMIYTMYSIWYIFILNFAIISASLLYDKSKFFLLKFFFSSVTVEKVDSFSSCLHCIYKKQLSDQ